MGIPWYMTDKRFEPGTVADVGYSVRLKLFKPNSKPNEWRLYMAIRTREIYGVNDNLLRPLKVAVFKKCHSLEDAQARAEAWFTDWRRDLF
ncbi:hypothetical protein [Paenibacillus cineris]|uniref:hypothetical protein n=1 Tax=Paenibacillus cineris TaxID=237530 RepID=UPI001B00DE07|nr:hypothetical protein [Paenibacillus cineris]GIO63555.1 hypothetical protein J43TS9_51290 [Paenibacillus cineris]